MRVLIFLTLCFRCFPAFSQEVIPCTSNLDVIQCFEEYRRATKSGSDEVAKYFSRNILEGWISYVSGDLPEAELLSSAMVVRSRSTFVRKMCDIVDIRYDEIDGSSGTLHVLSVSCNKQKPSVISISYVLENERWVIAHVLYKSSSAICLESPSGGPRLCTVEEITEKNEARKKE